MTLDEAREALARYGDPGVIYVPRGDGIAAAEEGTITSVGDKWVFVRYGRSRTSAATDPADLILLSADECAEWRRQWRAAWRRSLRDTPAPDTSPAGDTID